MRTVQRNRRETEMSCSGTELMCRKRDIAVKHVEDAIKELVELAYQSGFDFDTMGEGFKRRIRDSLNVLTTVRDNLKA